MTSLCSVYLRCASIRSGCGHGSSLRLATKRYEKSGLVEEAACLDPLLVNHPKDRHVLATAIRSGASTMVTFNLKDFSPASLSPWNIGAVHPSDFLISMHAFNPDQVLMRIAEMAGDRKMNGEMMLSKLNASVPDFIEHIAKSAEERYTSPHQLLGFRSSWKKTGTPVM